MAEKLCSLRKKGGGKMSETVLWTNSSPTSELSSRTVTLSNSLSNYDYLKISYTRANIAGEAVVSIIVPIDDFKRSLSGVNAPVVGICGSGGFPNSGITCYRRLFYISDTSIQIDNCYRLNAGGTYNTLSIVTSFIGLK